MTPRTRLYRASIAAFVAVALFATAVPLSAGIFGSNPRNVILIIPDGCSAAVWPMVRAMTVGADNLLAIDALPIQSRTRTYSADALITDSAAAGTALATGVKTRNGVIGKNAATTRGDSLSGASVTSILELAERAGYATGIVTTASIEHATPASFYAHSAERDWYQLIGNQLSGKGIEVLMGGGRQYLIPRGTTDEEGSASKRTDNRNIIDELRKEGYTYVHDSAGFQTVDPDTTTRLLGLFNPEHMQYELDRPKDKNGEPALWEMADKAISILSHNKNGFFLIIEAARIDMAAHDNNADRMLWDAIACDKTVAVAHAFAKKNNNTLLIVVPDHGTGGPNFIGVRNPATASGSAGDAEAPVFFHNPLDQNGFPTRQERTIAVGWASSKYYLGTTNEHGEHTGEDVSVHAFGPGSEKLTGLNNNIDIFKVMAEHLKVTPSKKKTDLSDIVDF